MGMPNGGKIPVRIDVGLNTSEALKSLDSIEAKIQKLNFEIKTEQANQNLKALQVMIEEVKSHLKTINSVELSQALKPIKDILDGINGNSGKGAVKTIKELTESLKKITSGETTNGKQTNPFDNIVKDYEKAIRKVSELEAKSLDGKNITSSFTNRLKVAREEEARLAAHYKVLVETYGKSEKITTALKERTALLDDTKTSNELKQMAKELADLDKASKESAERAKRDADIQYQAVKKISDAYKEVEKNASNYYKLQAKKETDQKLSNAEYFYLSKNKKLFDSYKNQTGVFDESQYSSLPIDLNERKQATLKAEHNAQLSMMSSELDAYMAKLDALRAKRDDYPVFGEFSSQLNQADIASSQLKTHLDEAFKSGKLNVDEFYTSLINANTALKKTETIARDSENKLASMFDVSSAQNGVSSWISQNTKYLNAHRDEVYALRDRANSLNNQSTLGDVNAINVALRQMDSQAKNLGQNGLSVLSRIDKAAGYTFGGMLTAFTTINLAGKINECVEASNKLNASMVELSKVSDATISSLNSQFDDFAKISKDIGGSINDTIKATSDWSRNGYSLPDSKELSRVSQLYKNIGDGINIDEANESLVSTMQGFKMQASEAEHIVDVINEVSNNEATSSAGIGEALKRSAASFEVANTSLEKSVALITATNSVVQDPSRVGNMWKSVSARIRGAKAEVKEMGEDTEGMVESTSQLRDLIKGMTGFDIMKDKNTFKDMYEIIVGIGEKWKDLSDVNQAALLEKLAGKTQANALAATLNNIDTLKKAYGEAMNSQGSAEKEQAHYEEGVEYHLNQMTIAWEQFSHDVVNSDVVKIFADLGAGAINLFNALHKLTGIAPELTMILGITKIVGNGGLQGSYTKISDYFKNLKAEGKGVETVLTDLGNTTARVFSSIPGKIIIAVAAVAALKHIYDEVHVTLEELDAKTSEHWDKYNEANGKAEEHAKRVEELKDRYKALSQGVNDKGENISLTTSEYEEYNSVVNELAEMFPDLVKGWTTAGNAIMEHKGKVDELTEAYKKQGIEAQNALIKSGGSDILDNYLGHTKGENHAFGLRSLGNKELEDIAGNLANAKDSKALAETIVDVYSKYSGKWGISSKELNELFKDTGLDKFGFSEAELLKSYVEHYSHDDAVDNILNIIEKTDSDFDFSTMRNKAKSSESNYASEKQKAQSELNKYTNILVDSAFNEDKYKDVNEKGKESAKTLIDAFSDGWANQAEKENPRNKDFAFDSYVNQAVDKIANDKELQNAITGILNLDTDNMSIADVKEQTDAYAQTIADAFGMSIDDVKDKMELTGRDKLLDSFNAMVNDGAKKFSGESSGANYDEMVSKINEFTEKNSVNADDEIKLLNACMAKADTWQDALKSYLDQIENKDVIEKGSLEYYSNEVNTYSEKAKTFNTAVSAVTQALDEQASNGYVSADSIKTLTACLNGAEDAFIRTSDGVRVNTDALRDMLRTNASEAIDKLGEDYDGMADKLKDNMDQLSDLYSQLSSARTEDVDSIREQIATLEGNNDALEKHMSEVQALQDIYRSTTNTFLEFQNAVNSKNSGNRYDYVRGQKANIEKEIKEGWVGNDEVRAYIDMFSNKDLSNASIDELSASWDHAKKFADTYFTESSKGVQAFYKKVESLAESGTDGVNKTATGIEVNAEKLAKALDVDVEAVQLLMEKCQEAGSEIKFDEATTSATNLNDALNQTGNTLGALKGDIEKLKELSGDFNGDVELSGGKITIDKDHNVDSVIAEIQGQIDTLNSNIVLTVDTKQAIEEIQHLQGMIDEGKLSAEELKNAQAKQKELADKVGTTVTALLNIDTSKAEESVDGIKSYVKDSKPDLKVTADTTQAKTAIQGLLDLIPSEKDIKLNVVLPGADVVSGIIKKATEGNDRNDNNSNSQSSNKSGKRSNAQGSGGIPSDGKSLVGEQGQELLVRDGHYQTIGDNGAEIIDVKKDDIIFTATQTKELLEKGKINGRGATVGGKAFAEGKAYSGGFMSAPKNSFGSETVGVKAEKAKTKESKKQAKNERTKTQETKKQYDWIEKAKTIVGQKISDLEHEATDERKTLSDRLDAYEKIKDLDKERIEINQKALDRYKEGWEEAKAKIKEVFGTDTTSADEYIRKIENGDVDKDTWKDVIYQDADNNNVVTDLEKQTYSKITTAIDDGIKSYDNMLTAHSNLVSAEDEATQHVEDAYKAQLDANQAYIDKIDTRISELQSNVNIKKISGRGYVSQRDYKNQISATEEKIEALYARRSILESQAADAEVSGDDGSASASSISSAISDVDKEINSLRESIAELNESIKDIPIQNVDNYRENLSTITSDFNNLRAEQEALGKVITTDVVNGETKVNEVLAEQAKHQRELIKERMKTYDVGTDKWNEMYKQLQEMDDALSNIVQNMIDLQKQLLQMPVDGLEKVANQLSSITDSLNEIKNDNTSIINFAQTTIQRAMDQNTDKIDVIKKDTEKATKPLEDQLKILQKQNDARQRQLDIDQARYNLEKAQEESMVKVVRNGKFVYDQDQDAVREARNSLDTAEYNKTTGDLQAKIDSINDEADKQTKVLQDENDRLTKFNKKWEKIASDTEYDLSKANLHKLTGRDADKTATDVLNGNDFDLYNKTKKDYRDNVFETEKVKNASEDVSFYKSALETLNQRLLKGEITQQEFTDALSRLDRESKDGFSSDEKLKEILNINGQKSIDGAIDNARKAIDDVDKTYNDKILAEWSNLETQINKFGLNSDEVVKNSKDSLEKLKGVYNKVVSMTENVGRIASYISRSSSDHDGGHFSPGVTSHNIEGYDIPVTGRIHNANSSDGSSSWHSESSYSSHSSSSSSSSSSGPSGTHKDWGFNKGIEKGAIKRFATGIAQGAIQDTDDERVKILQKMAMSKMTPTEVPAFLDVGEVVLNPQQQTQLLENMRNSLAVSSANVQSRPSEAPIVNISLGDLSLPNVNDAQSFAEALGQQLENTMNQQFTKIFKR